MPPDCTLEVCGDGIDDPQEQCDDGGTMSGDGCNALCESEATHVLARDRASARTRRHQTPQTLAGVGSTSIPAGTHEHSRYRELEPGPQQFTFFPLAVRTR
jgi:cysteine-rich repeat protein